MFIAMHGSENARKQTFETTEEEMYNKWIEEQWKNFGESAGANEVATGQQVTRFQECMKIIKFYIKET
jgi:hypothetical protein